MSEQYEKTLEAITTFENYLQGNKPENVAKAIWNLDYYLDNPKEFSEEESLKIDRGLARLAFRYIAKGLSKK